MVRLSPSRPLTPRPHKHFNFVKLWTAFLIESCALPFCILYTLLVPYVVWGGITYRKRQGKVCVHKQRDGSLPDIADTSEPCKNE